MGRNAYDLQKTYYYLCNFFKILSFQIDLTKDTELMQLVDGSELEKILSRKTLSKLTAFRAQRKKTDIYYLENRPVSESPKQGVLLFTPSKKITVTHNVGHSRMHTSIIDIALDDGLTLADRLKIRFDSANPVDRDEYGIAHRTTVDFYVPRSSENGSMEGYTEKIAKVLYKFAS